MKTVVSWSEPPSRCDYSADHVCGREYLYVASLRPDEYMAYLLAGWRRFGHTLFRPNCPACSDCQSIRVPVAAFRPSRSQRRAWDANRDVELTIGRPQLTGETLALYDAFHACQSEAKGWPAHEPDAPEAFAESFIHNPFATEQWEYRVGGKCIGVGYVDRTGGGLSAIYFFYDPKFRDRQLGTWNVLSLIDETRRRKLPHLYLGYFVGGCRSLEYKATYRPNETLSANGKWELFRE